jgi:predicted NAD/FAD-binding protein
VAIVGSGCAGIAALWALNRSPHDVYLFEAADRLGGHTNTVEFSNGKYKTMVDTGFIVMNSATYRTVPPKKSGSWLTRCSQFHQFPQQDQCQD